MTVLVMSEKKFGRVEALQRVADGLITVSAAASVMGVTRRHATRLIRAYGASGPAGPASRRRGKPSNRRLSEGFRSA